MTEIASAKLGYVGKDQDTVVVRRLAHGYLLAVADGVSMDAGRAAAEWAQDFLLRTDETSSVKRLFDAMCDELRASCIDGIESKTTLTCGLLTEAQESGHLYFQFFAVGDSPIWRVVRTRDGRYPYQRYVVHAGPYPAETAKLYSTVSIGERRITGTVSFGSVEIGLDELLIICSDGVPEREMFVRDLNIEATGGQTLLQTLFSTSTLTDESLLDAIKTYASRDALADDASIIVAKPMPAEQSVDKTEREYDYQSVDPTEPSSSRQSAEDQISSDALSEEEVVVAAVLEGTSDGRKRGLTRQSEIPYSKGTRMRLQGTAHVATVKSKYQVIFEGNPCQLRKLTLQLLGCESLDRDATLYWELDSPM